jgi:hypothetical protein
VNLLADHLECIAVEQGPGVAGFVATLGLRIRAMLSDQHLGAVVGGNPSFEAWLKEYVGANQAANGNVAIIDLSLLPSEEVHIVVAVLGRLVFESLQRYRRNDPIGEALPTVLSRSAKIIAN